MIKILFCSRWTDIGIPNRRGEACADQEKGSPAECTGHHPFLQFQQNVMIKLRFCDLWNNIGIPNRRGGAGVDQEKRMTGGMHQSSSFFAVTAKTLTTFLFSCKCDRIRSRIDEVELARIKKKDDGRNAPVIIFFCHHSKNIH